MFTALLALSALATETYDRSCWEAAVYDLDDDGYADTDADSGDRVEQTFSTADDRLRCPAGWVAKRGDCDDSDPDVHPRQQEVYGNDVDDNCSGTVDEPDFQYFPSGFANTTSSFKMRVHVRDAETMSAWRTRTTSAFAISRHGLGYDITWQNLTNTGVVSRTTKATMSTMTDVGTNRYADLTLSGLAATDVFRAQVQFYTWSTNLLGVTTWTPVGDPSPWYYTTTDGTSEVSLDRTQMLLQGFYEFYISEHKGLVGYHGATYEDGTRYGADLGEAWCSEFYSSMVAWVLPAMSVETYTEHLLDWFHGYGEEIDDQDAGWDLDDVKADAYRADYLAIDSDPDDDEDYNHSAMFLAYDSFLDRFWTLEGNSDLEPGTDAMTVLDRTRRGGNEVTIDNIDPIIVAGWGHLSSAMW